MKTIYFQYFQIDVSVLMTMNFKHLISIYEQEF